MNFCYTFSSVVLSSKSIGMNIFGPRKCKFSMGAASVHSFSIKNDIVNISHNGYWACVS